MLGKYKIRCNNENHYDKICYCLEKIGCLTLPPYFHSSCNDEQYCLFIYEDGSVGWNHDHFNYFNKHLNKEVIFCATKNCLCLETNIDSMPEFIKKVNFICLKNKKPVNKCSMCEHYIIKKESEKK
jgi:hypothetical protein